MSSNLNTLNLQTFNKLYPMIIHQYNELFDDQNASVMDRINTIVDYLNQVGKLTNDVVKDWNTVYQWVMNDGLTTDLTNAINSGAFNSILATIYNAELGDLTQLQTVDKSNLVAAINDNVVSLAQIATNVLTLGIKGDGSDETAAINNLLATYKNLYFPKPPVNYTINGTLNIVGTTDVKQGMKIEFAQGAILKQTANVPAFKITGQGHKIKTPLIDVSAMGSNFTGTLVLLYSDSSALPCMYNTISDITLLQTAKTGWAIEVHTLNDGWAYYNRITGTIQFFFNGLRINSNSTNQVNNNYFDLNINSAQQTMYIESTTGNLGGNIFKGNCQATSIDNSTPERACVYVHNAAQNEFDQYIYDVGLNGLVKWAYELDNCGFNTINNVRSNRVKITNGLNNTNPLIGSPDTIINNNVSLPFRGDWDLPYSASSSFTQLDEYYKRYYGITPINNTLANLKSLSSLTINTSDCTLHAANTMTNLNDLLNHNALTYLRYQPNSSPAGGTVELVISLSTSKKIRTFGCITGYTDSQMVQVNGFYWNTSTSAWVQCTEIFPNDSQSYKSTHLFQGGVTTNQIKLQFVIPANSVLAYGYFLTLHYIYANFVGLSDGGSPLPYIGGDTFTGDIKFSTNASINIGAVSSLPTADSTQRGRIVTLQGGTGNADLVLLGTKLSDGTYIWKSIGQDANTTANRPGTNLYPGRPFFDTTLNKPIWRNASNNGWVDATGATV